MGKQINYWMDYNDFVVLAQKALEMGCVIYRRCAEKDGRLAFGRDISVVAPEVYGYWFYLPQAGEIVIGTRGGREYVDVFDNTALIEAGFSCVDAETKKISRSRLWCSTGFYDKDGEFIKRPEELTRVYNTLARFAKKLAPYTEVTRSYVSRWGDNCGETVEYRKKEYVSQSCIDKMAEGYELVT